MKLKKIVIEEQQYGANKGKMVASATLVGTSYPADINIPIPDELLSPIADILMQAVAATMAQAAADFAADVKGSLSPPIEAVAIEAPTA